MKNKTFILVIMYDNGEWESKEPTTFETVINWAQAALRRDDCVRVEIQPEL
jgi:hypothetical protein